MKFIAEIFVFPIKLYQWFLSPILRTVFGMRCRYEPSCSHYTVGAIREWGAFRGMWLGLKRIISCNPYGGMGDDPVPLNPKRNKDKVS